MNLSRYSDIYSTVDIEINRNNLFNDAFYSIISKSSQELKKQLAINNKQYLPISFTLLMYKKILNKSFEFSDLKLLDPQLYQNLQQLKYE